jgi:hypothetical protein
MSLQPYSPRLLHEHEQAPSSNVPAGAPSQVAHDKALHVPRHKSVGAHFQPLSQTSHGSGAPVQVPRGHVAKSTVSTGHVHEPFWHSGAANASDPQPWTHVGPLPMHEPPELELEDVPAISTELLHAGKKTKRAPKQARSVEVIFIRQRYHSTPRVRLYF